MLQSILDYKERGPWGDPKYRGNCSGHVIRDLLRHFQPGHFGEVFAGGGTGAAVAKEMGYANSFHLDLNPSFGGWNALTDEVPEGSDFVFLHPPYHSIIQYSGVMWGDPHPDDLSRCGSYDEFIKKLDHVHSKVYTSLRNGGRMAILVGDCRRDGEYFSIQRDMAWLGHVEAHLIKVQNNHQSRYKRYVGKFIPIVHEHLLIFKKNDAWLVPITIVKKVSRDLRQSQRVTWRDVVQAALEQLGGSAPLSQIYQVVKCTEKARGYKTVEEKVRQVLQIHPDFESVDRGIWCLRRLEKRIATA